MINKQTKFIDRNARSSDPFAFKKASHVESAFSRLALELSLYPERPEPARLVASAFGETNVSGYTPSKTDLENFARAAKIAYRMESSLRVKPGIDREFCVRNPLTLQIKFYYKNDRQEFLQWSMTFGELGRIHLAGMTRYGTFAEK